MAAKSREYIGDRDRSVTSGVILTLSEPWVSLFDT